MAPGCDACAAQVQDVRQLFDMRQEALTCALGGRFATVNRRVVFQIC